MDDELLELLRKSIRDAGPMIPLTTTFEMPSAASVSFKRMPPIALGSVRVEVWDAAEPAEGPERCRCAVSPPCRKPIGAAASELMLCDDCAASPEHLAANSQPRRLPRQA